MIFFSFILSFSLCARIPVILIDPGHGGDEDGAIFSSLKEKDITLRISKQIKEKLKKDYKVYLTRSVDKNVSLEERAALAELLDVDIFISVHINSSKDRRSNGIETYYLKNNKTEIIKKISDIENTNLKGEKLLINNILIDLIIGKTSSLSKKLAKSVHHKITVGPMKKYKLKNRGIRPGPFYVLALSKRPSILLECGFISNKNDRNKILNDKFIDSYAISVAKGVRKYFSSTKKYTLSKL